MIIEFSYLHAVSSVYQEHNDAIELIIQFDHIDASPIGLLPKFIRLGFEFAATRSIIIPVRYNANNEDEPSNLTVCERDWNDEALNSDVILNNDGYIEQYTPKTKYVYFINSPIKCYINIFHLHLIGYRLVLCHTLSLMRLGCR